MFDSVPFNIIIGNLNSTVSKKRIFFHVCSIFWSAADVSTGKV